MRKTLLVAAVIGSFSSFALASSTAAATDTVHVKLEVKSNLYGSFTEERDVPVGQPSVFERTTGEHKRVDYSGPCKVDLPVGMPPTILDRTRIVVAPFGGPDDGKIFAQTSIEASKFTGRRETEVKNCGTVAFGNSTHAEFGNTWRYRLGHAETVYQADESPTAATAPNLIVKLTFTPAASKAD
ncbi:hypothetical protein C6T65_12065 [Burkholderia vietnamiensis]|uniref:Uncharacterized protein n=1 Tax=Burkholderia vietnamiensis TaxID=60552 RepID=A0AA44Y170_BURVI|nr:hypothetical protein [Burkholderia vietnamiensis]PRH42084.1 hypothetical protein C6T65_12065 [Burkholderia vietnamiensis]